MIRFSARGAYLLLELQGKALIRNRVLTERIREGAYFFFEKQQDMKQSFDVYLKRIKKTGKRTSCPWILPC